MIAGLVGSLGALVAYVTTLAPSLTWAHDGADGGDLIAAIARGGLPHPPGFPTYLLFGELFIRLPWGDPAWRLNLLSAVASASAAGLVVAAAYVFTNRLPASVVAGLCLGFAPLVWAQAVIAEVYALAVCCAALTMYLALKGAHVGFLGFVWGVGLGAHPLLAFYAPLVLWSAWQNRAARTRCLAQGALGAAIGWGIVYGLVVVVRAGTPSPWVEMNSFASWWAYVSAEIYRGYAFALPPSARSQRILAWLGILARQFTPMGAAIALWGGIALWRSQRALAIVTLAIVVGTSVFAITYNTTDSIVYLTLALPLVALWLAMGLSRLARWRWSSALILLLPLLQLTLFWGEVDLHADRAAVTWVARVLNDAPPRAILVTAQDRHTFALWYAHDVLGARPDIVVIDRDLWETRPYRKMMARVLGVADVSFDDAVRATDRPFVDASESMMGEIP